MLNNNRKPLQENEIAGAVTANTVIRHLQGMNSLSEFLSIEPNGQGSVNFDFDAYSLAKVILGMVEDGETLSFDFKCKLDKKHLTVVAGKVYLPDTPVVSISSMSQTLGNSDSGKMVYVRLSKSGSTISGELVFDDPVTHTLMTGNNNYRVCLPVAIVTGSGNNWKVRYMHLGSFSLTQVPYFWIDAYDKSKAQFLSHGANADGETWIDATECE